jgi:hypothetical protein
MWSQYGGDAIVTRMASKLGLANTRPPVVAGRWGDTRTSAADVAKTYHYLMNDAGGGTKDVILRALDGTTEYGSDGIRQYFGIPDGVGDLRWQVKQGWSCCRDNRIIHSSGIVGGRYIVVVLTSQPTSLGYAAAGNRVTDVVEALRPALVVSN